MSDTLIGVPRPRLDAPDKVTGATRFAADGYVHGLLHARPVLSTEAHARIRGVDKDAALATPGVVAVLAGSRPSARDDRERPNGGAARARGGRLRRSACRARRGRDGGGGRGRRGSRGRRVRAARGRRRRGSCDGAGSSSRTHRRGVGGGRRPRVHPCRGRPRPGGRPRRGALRQRARSHHPRARRRCGRLRRE